MYIQPYLYLDPDTAVSLNLDETVPLDLNTTVPLDLDTTVYLDAASCDTSRSRCKCTP